MESVQDPDGIVFLNSFGRRIDPKYARDRLLELCQAAKVPPISPHQLRHTCATFLLAETGDLHAVQKVLGHSLVALTAKLYGHATAETLRSVVNVMEKLLGTCYVGPRNEVGAPSQAVLNKQLDLTHRSSKRVHCGVQA